MSRELRFCWWNLQDFAHFDANRVGQDRWPVSVDHYQEKRRRVEAAFDAMFGSNLPDVIGLCEITKKVAMELQKRKFPDHQLILLEPRETEEFQVVLLIRRNASLSRRPSLHGHDVPERTRPMCVALFEEPTVSILFVACHWAAFDDKQTADYRRRCADTLRGGIYDFLNPRLPPATPRHALVIGDLNVEPFDDLFEVTLSASRDHDHARGRLHYSDAAVSRTRLYNCGWRLLGEERPHGSGGATERRVGTYYRTSSHSWRTYDQVLVTGELLGDQPPYFDESSLLVRTDVGNLVEGKPAKFAFASGVGTGLSDHYPVTGRLLLG
jgi:endonuclease/exonuclease/phosphatase family metal-dependent hydrolase